MKYLFIFLIAFFISGCSVSKQIVGEYYLENKNLKSGTKHFENEVKQNPLSASNQYYYGRFLLASNQANEAIIHLKKAIELDKTNSTYYSWLGVAYGTIKNLKQEKKSYIKALEFDKKNIQALTYLGHNSFEQKDYLGAIKYYEEAIKVDEFNQKALYNYALSQRKLKRIPEEIAAWKRYLDYYPSGFLAKKAVEMLNSRNDFSYKNHLIGFKTISLKEIEFEPISNKLSLDSKKSLDVIANVLNTYKNLSIHIVSYQYNNKELARLKALSIKNYLVSKGISSNRLSPSWFSKRKKVSRNFFLMQTSDFITVVK